MTNKYANLRKTSSMKKQGSVKKISVTPKGGKDKGKAKTENKADKEESKETAAERRARVKKKFKRAKLIIGAAKGFKVKKFERRTSKISKSPTDGGPTADIDSTKKKALGSRRASKIQALTERMSTTENIAKDETYIMHHEMGLPPETIKKCQKRPSMWATSEFAYFDIEFVWKHYNQTNSDEGVLDPNDLSNLMDDMMTELFIVHTERILAESDKKMSEDGIRKQIYRDLAPSMNGERTKAGLRRHMQATILQKLDPEGKMGGITQRNFEAKWAKTTDELLRAKVAQSKKCVIL